MIKLLKNQAFFSLVTVITLTLLTLGMAGTSLALASGQQDITGQMKGAIDSVSTLPTAGGNADLGAQVIVGNIINALLGLFGVFFMVLIIYGGYRWMNARGSQDEIDKAKKIIQSAIIGFIIVFLAYAISLFVTTALMEAIPTN